MRKRGRPPHPELLTPREQEVLVLLQDGCSNREIAQRLGISHAGAAYHVKEILSKLNVTSRYEAAAWPLEAVRMRRRVPFPAILSVAAGRLTNGIIGRVVGGGVLAIAVLGLGLLALGVVEMDRRETDLRESVVQATAPSEPIATATPIPTKQFVKGGWSFVIPAEWSSEDADGHDFSVITFSLPSGDVRAVGLISSAPEWPPYDNVREEVIAVDGVEASLVKGLVKGRTALDDYLGPTEDVPSGGRLDANIHASSPGGEEWRVKIDLGDRGFFDFAMAIRRPEDGSLFLRILDSMTLP